VDAQAEAAAVKKPVKSATDELVEESRHLIEMSRTLRDLEALRSRRPRRPSQTLAGY
jgi:hypothetical protein